MKKTMGELIAENRKEKELTQRELAEKMGVTDKAVSKWERNLSCPDINSLPKLSETLGISIDELIQMKEAAPSEKKGLEELIDTVFKGVGLAMGIGLTCLAISSLVDESSHFRYHRT